MTDPHPELPVDPDPAQQAPSRPVHVRPVLMLAVIAGGLIGAPARYLLGVALPTPPDGWPTATFVVNLAGAFVLGVLLEGLARSGPDVGWRRGVRLFAGTGFCGALTTYSTLAVELDLLGHHGRWGLAAGYAVASVVAGLLLAAAGVALAAAVHRRRRAGRGSVASSTGRRVAGRSTGGDLGGGGR